MKPKSRATLGRRQFLGALGLGAAVTATSRLATEAMAGSETSDEKRKARYKETEHVKAFYRVNHYPRRYLC